MTATQPRFRIEEVTTNSDGEPQISRILVVARKKEGISPRKQEESNIATMCECDEYNCFCDPQCRCDKQCKDCSCYSHCSCESYCRCDCDRYCSCEGDCSSHSSCDCDYHGSIY